MTEPERRIAAVGYAAAAVLVIDQLSQVSAALPFDPTLRLAWFQIANTAASRLWPVVIASLLVLFVGIKLGHRLAVRISVVMGLATAAAAFLVIYSVLWDGAYLLDTFGPPGGRLQAFQSVRIRSLAGAALTLMAVAGATPAGVRAMRGPEPEPLA